MDLDLPWPPTPISTERLVLRQTEARDRDHYIGLLSSAEVFRYLGGARPREELQRTAPAVPGRCAGVFAAEADGRFIGSVTLDRRDPERPGHVRDQGNEIEISYTFLPSHWGCGYASEAAAAVLAWIDEVAGEDVVLCTQTANVPSMRLAARLGFREFDRFVEFDAEQWFGVRSARAGAA